MPDAKETPSRELDRRFLDVWNGITELRELQQEVTTTLSQHGQSISLLIGIVRGNQDLNLQGMVDKFGKLAEDVEEIKKTQAKAEDERKTAKERWKYLLIGVSLSALPGIETVYKALHSVGVLP